MTHNGNSRVGKLTFENLKMPNFPWVAHQPIPSPFPILGQTIDRCIKQFSHAKAKPRTKKKTIREGAKVF